MLADGKADLARAVRQLATRVDGHRRARLGRHAAEAVARGPARSKPVVIIAGTPQPASSACGAENASSAEQLTEHVLAHGRTRLLFVGDPDGAPDIRERYAGFVAAHRARGPRAGRAGPRPVPRGGGRRPSPSGSSPASIEADALVCANDELALASWPTCRTPACDVPGDIAVVGWDDVMAARYVRPGLTTVRQPVRELGVLAADAPARARLRRGRPARSPSVLPTEVVIRGSCGCRHPLIPHPADPLTPGTGDAHAPTHRRDAHQKVRHR